jgi:hypothetical protein
MSLYLPVDHVVLTVPDLSAAGAAFERAGFHVTPETRHDEALGTANRCVMLDGTYVELMGVVAETPANATWRRLLEAGPGLRGLAFRSDDIEATATALDRKNIRRQPVRRFSRATAEGELRFSVIRIDPQETPGLQCLVCQHHTPELLWVPKSLTHPNGATALVEFALPEVECLSRFAEETGVRAVPGKARLTIAGLQQAQHDLTAAYGIEVEMIAP